MNFASPRTLWLVPLYLIIAAYIFYRIRGQSLSLSTLAFVRERRTWRTLAAQSGALLTAAATALLLAALAGPNDVETRKLVLPSGIEIMVALDVSGSMAGEDFQPQNRLAVAKDVLHDFILGRPSDRIGLILFAGRSVTRSPLTLQHDPLLKTLDRVDMGTLPDGTAIGSAILSGINRLSSQSEGATGDRILVLITDGRNNAGEVHPYDTLPIAQQKTIRIYTVGVGGYGDVPFPVETPDGKKSYRYEKADLDEVLLQRIAETTGGKYFRAADPKSLTNLFEQINRLEKSEPKAIETRTVRSRAQQFLVPALILSLVGFGLLALIRRAP
jgi:Ca-activated chloride channel family protein